jgi:hypothetical protein
MMYLLETIENGHPHHRLCDGDKLSALKMAWMVMTMWVYGPFRGRCDPKAAKKVMDLTADNRYADAMDVWNAANTNPTIALHEVEILARDCHHDQDVLEREDEYYVVESDLEGVDKSVSLYPTNFAARELAAIVLRDWTSRNPLHGYKCGEATRQEVRRLLRKHNVPEAIDTWMSDRPNPTIAIHKLRVLKKGCHHDELGDNSPSQHGNCC